MKNTTATITLILTSIIAALAVRQFQATEPVYQGRKIGAWLDDLTSYDVSKQTRAVQAVRALGTNALPSIVKRLRAQDSSLKRKLIDFCEDHPAVPLIPVSAETGYPGALEACRILGPAAASAAPEIVNLLPSYQLGETASVLAAIGTAAVPVLQTALESDRKELRLGAALAVGKIARQPERVVQPLIASLDDPSTDLRMTAAWALGRLGAQAQAAVPKLSMLTNDAAYNVREQAALAIDKIARASHTVASVRE